MNIAWVLLMTCCWYVSRSWRASLKRTKSGIILPHLQPPTMHLPLINMYSATSPGWLPLASTKNKLPRKPPKKKAGSSWNETEWEKTWNKENEDWDKVLLIPVSITYDSSTSSSGNKNHNRYPKTTSSRDMPKLKRRPRKRNAKRRKWKSPLKNRSYIHQFQQVTDRYSIKKLRSL